MSSSPRTVSSGVMPIGCGSTAVLGRVAVPLPEPVVASTPPSGVCPVSPDGLPPFVVSVVPGSVVPGSVVPGSVVPGSVVPGSVVPGSVVPGSVVPGSVVPGSVVPGSVVPGSVVPGSSCPDQSSQGAVVPPVSSGVAGVLDDEALVLRVLAVQRPVELVVARRKGDRLGLGVAACAGREGCRRGPDHRRRTAGC